MTETPVQNSVRQAGGWQPVSLTIPCKAEYVSLCRLVVGALGTSEALDEELIADLKVVVTEACTCFLAGTGGEHAASQGGKKADKPSPALRIDLCPSPEAWTITVCSPELRSSILSSSSCDPMVEGSLGLTIIRALVDVVDQIESTAEGVVLRLVKWLPGEQAAGV